MSMKVTRCEFVHGMSCKEVSKFIGSIVRCRDCKWLDHHHLYLCMLPDGDGGYACWEVEPDGFCAWGERREL